ncbi:uncharacterized protein PV07_11885 [Cladophialophora immunda]|uniref:Cytochrome P450 oxidoreductase n=1 Tax=Cladophialophora immunda TaxID=569365 RepID=A0A0D1Z7T1_9EURO|nr:uncharacterized protein PV07_11885 [Cladophialophora immunda]KIW23706.1 hypothetical protein PV07_11885 [Cladophialophora immunda]OQV03370.1 hypothetical protein CLAIMM_08420 [Cladophialophora immunda]
MASSIQVIVLAIIISLVPLQLYFRYRKLSSIPGPFLASFTDLWRAYAQNYGTIATTLIKLHEQYGPLVRIGPNTIHVSDPAAVSTIYTNHGEFRKADSYSPLRVRNPQGKSAGSVIDMQDEEGNTLLKRGVGNAFATKTLLDYEHSVDDTVNELARTIIEEPEFDLFKTMQFFQLDMLTQLAFSENLGHLQNRRDVWGMVDPSRERIAHWVQWQALPNLEYLLYQHPLFNWVTKKSSAWALEALQKLATRESAPMEKTQGQKDLLQKYVDAFKKHPAMGHDNISLMTTSTISAGFDSTTVTMTTILFCLMKYPAACEKLKQELEAAKLSTPVPQWAEVNRLEYLDAVFKEALRCNPFVTIPLERIVPRGGAVIVGKQIPAGTTVGCAAKVIHNNRELFGEDVEEFRPERWLVDPEKRLAMERASMGFGSGKRICLGRHIAELEIKKLIPALVLRFKMDLVTPDASLDFADGLTAFPKTIMVKFEERK